MNPPSYHIENTVEADNPLIYHLFEEAIAYQKRKGYPVWRGYDKEVLAKDRLEQRQFKIVINQEIACIFSICYEDPLIWQERDQDDAIYLHRIVVNPKYKGQQQFGKIMAWAIQHAREKNRAYLRMDTWDDNPPLVDYYKKFDFIIIDYFTTPDTEELPPHHRGNPVVLMEYAIH